MDDDLRPDWSHKRQTLTIIGAVVGVGMFVLGVITVMIELNGVRDSDKNAVSSNISALSAQIDGRITALEKRVSAHDVSLATLTWRADTQQNLLTEMRGLVGKISDQVTEMRADTPRHAR